MIFVQIVVAQKSDLPYRIRLTVNEIHSLHILGTQTSIKATLLRPRSNNFAHLLPSLPPHGH